MTGCASQLVEYPETGAANGLTPSKPYFVELWDIGAKPPPKGLGMCFLGILEVLGIGNIVVKLFPLSVRQ